MKTEKTDVKIINEKPSNKIEKEISREFTISKKNLIIMIVYLNVNEPNYNEFAQKLLDKFQTQAGILEKWYVVPDDGETRIECLNPKIVEKGERPELEKQINDNVRLFEEQLND